MKHAFRQAEKSDLAQIWLIIQSAIVQRKADGSDQWQDGYPNLNLLREDIQSLKGFVLVDGEAVIGYCAISINDEPEYDAIEGSWLTQGDFAVFHRLAISNTHAGKGLGIMMIQFIEAVAANKGVKSVKADTNHDNPAMLKCFEQSGYTYCGIVHFRGSPRKAYEKLVG